MQRWKSNYLSVLAALYVVDIVVLTVGYFTPWWVRDYERWPDGAWWYMLEPKECATAGLISGHCRYPYSSISKSGWHLGMILSLCFYFMLAAMIFVYSNALMILVAWYFKMYKGEVYMSFLAISCGVLYPMAGLLTVMSSVFVIATYTPDSGYSVYLCLIAGFLNLVCYSGLRLYDYMYITARNQKKQAENIKTS